jgi:hypothetical protein
MIPWGRSDKGGGTLHIVQPFFASVSTLLPQLALFRVPLASDWLQK